MFILSMRTQLESIPIFNVCIVLTCPYFQCINTIDMHNIHCVPTLGMYTYCEYVGLRTLNARSMFSPPQNFIPSSNSPMSRKNCFSITNIPPIVIGVLKKVCEIESNTGPTHVYKLPGN